MAHARPDSEARRRLRFMARNALKTDAIQLPNEGFIKMNRYRIIQYIHKLVFIAASTVRTFPNMVAILTNSYLTSSRVAAAVTQIIRGLARLDDAMNNSKVDEDLRAHNSVELSQKRLLMGHLVWEKRQQN